MISRVWLIKNELTRCFLGVSRGLGLLSGYFVHVPAEISQRGRYVPVHCRENHQEKWAVIKQVDFKVRSRPYSDKSNEQQE